MRHIAVATEPPPLRRKRRGLFCSLALLSIAVLACPVAARELHVSRSADGVHPSDVAQDLGFAAWPALAGLGVAAVIVGAAGSRRTRSPARGAACESIPTDAPMLSTIASLSPVVRVAPDVTKDREGDEPLPGDTAAAAGAYLAPHHVDLAIDALRRALSGATRRMPVARMIWLDLCRRHGRRPETDALAHGSEERFEGRQRAGSRDQPDASEPGLEAFPRLVHEITAAWGTHECRRLIDRVLFDGRSGVRSALTLNAYNDLRALSIVCDEYLRTIEADFVEEAMVREAFAVAKAGLPTGGYTAPRCGMADGDDALTRELEAQLAEDVRLDAESRSPLEIEHPALAGMLVHEWSNSALAARLCEILSAIIEDEHSFSAESLADLGMLRLVADDLAGEPHARNVDG